MSIKSAVGIRELTKDLTESESGVIFAENISRTVLKSVSQGGRDIVAGKVDLDHSTKKVVLG